MKVQFKVVGYIGIVVIFATAAVYCTIKPATSKAKGVDAVKSKSHGPMDEFIRVASGKEKRITELYETMKYAVNIRGRIVRALNWQDFPSVEKKINEVYPDANQILQIDSGEAAILITRKSNFQTTGNFRMTAQKFMETETSRGKVTVLVESPESETAEAEWNQIRIDMKELTLQYMEKRLPDFLPKAEGIAKTSGLPAPAIAGLLFVDDLGEKAGDESSLFVYQLANDLSTCAFLQNQKVTAESWAHSYSLAFPKEKAKGSFALGQHCANGGPFTYQDRVLTFAECMCGGGERDPFLTSDYTSRKRYSKLLNALDKKVEISTASTGDAQSTKRSPASQQH